MKKIGVLIPQSKTYPTLGKEFLNGIKLSNNEDYSFLVEGIGMGNDADGICDKLDRLVLQEDIAAVVCFVGDHNLNLLYDKVNGLEVPAIFVRFGAFPNIKAENNKYAFTLSYGICDGLASLGTWLVENGKKEIAVSGSFNDVGYGMLTALEKTIYAAGGAFAGHYVPPNEPREDEAEVAASFYRDVDFDAVIHLYNGIFAEENVQYIEQLENSIEEPAYFTPFGFDKAQLQRLKTKVNDLNMVASWIPIELRANPTSFDNDFYAMHDKYPSIQSMLGYECFQLLKNVIPERKKVLEEGLEFESETGRTTVNKDLVVELNHKMWKAVEKSDGWTLQEEFTLKQEKDNLSFEGQQTGWHNAYLCY